jgi:methionine-R-sulfoxide reductase
MTASFISGLLEKNARRGAVRVELAVRIDDASVGGGGSRAGVNHIAGAGQQTGVAAFLLPLFAATDKFAGGSGWPSFTQPVDVSAVREAEDASIGMRRTEIRSARGDAHLGHVFDDGPALFGGKRYCVNSASMRFIPRAEMEAAGYGAYITLIDNPPRPAANPAPSATPG